MLTMFALVVIVFLLVIVALLAMIFSEAKKGLYVPDNTKNQSADSEREPFQTETHSPIGPIEKIKLPWESRSTSEIIGEIGESLVFDSLFHLCQRDGRYFRIAKNLYVPKKNGYSEIDVLLLHETGIYVIESKNLRGEIVGNADDTEWDLFQGENIHHTFRNPLMQNEGHICALRKFLGIRNKSIPVYNVVIFGKKSDLKSVPDDTKQEIIMTYYRIDIKFDDFIKSKKNCLSKGLLDKFSERLMPCVNVSSDVKARHKKQLLHRFGKAS